MTIHYLDAKTRAQLSEKMKDFCCGLTAVHDIARVFARRLGKDPKELHAKYPPMEHPVIRTHPETGERLIYVNIFCEVGRLTHRFIVSCKLTDVDMVTAGILIFLHLEVDF